MTTEFNLPSIAAHLSSNAGPITIVPNCASNS